MAVSCARCSDYISGEESGPGEILTTPFVTTVYVNNLQICLKGQEIAPHIPCDPVLSPEHCVATMVGCSTTVYAGMKGVCRVNDAATCGGTVQQGSPNVYVG